MDWKVSQLLRSKAAAYLVKEADGGDAYRRLVSAMLGACKAMAGLGDERDSGVTDGVRAVTAPVGIIREAVNQEMEFAAAEVVDLAGGRVTTCFLGVGEDGLLRVCISMRGYGVAVIDDDVLVPDWLLSAGLTIEQCEVKGEVDFSLLVAVLTAGSGCAVSWDKHKELETALADAAYWRGVATEQRRQIRLRSRRDVERLESEAVEVRSPEDEQPEPSSQFYRLDEIELWAEMHKDRIIIMPRAISETKKSVYHDPELLYASLDALARLYPKMKAGEISHNELKEGLSEIGVYCAGSVEPSRAGMEGDRYFIQYGGRRLFLDQKIAKGGSRDVRFTLRIYFTWSDELGKVIVGHMPTHLPNSIT